LLVGTIPAPALVLLFLIFHLFLLLLLYHTLGRIATCQASFCLWRTFGGGFPPPLVGDYSQSHPTVIGCSHVVRQRGHCVSTSVVRPLRPSISCSSS
jgi:hypothetical protein